jgi:hypothetical protein
MSTPDTASNLKPLAEIALKLGAKLGRLATLVNTWPIAPTAIRNGVPVFDEAAARRIAAALASDDRRSRYRPGGAAYEETSVANLYPKS